jgi:hypothetical protein
MTIADEVRASNRLAYILRRMTAPRVRMLVDIDSREPAPGSCTGVHRAVWHWLEAQGLVAVTREGTRLVSTHEGRRLASVAAAAAELTRGEADRG